MLLFNLSMSVFRSVGCDCIFLKLVCELLCLVFILDSYVLNLGLKCRYSQAFQFYFLGLTVQPINIRQCEDIMPT